MYPDSGKIDAFERRPDGAGLNVLFRAGDAVDYWEGECRAGFEPPSAAIFVSHPRILGALQNLFLIYRAAARFLTALPTNAAPHKPGTVATPPPIAPPPRPAHPSQAAQAHVSLPGRSP